MGVCHQLGFYNIFYSNCGENIVIPGLPGQLSIMNEAGELLSESTAAIHKSTLQYSTPQV